MRIFLTGATGVIGRRVLPLLVREAMGRPRSCIVRSREPRSNLREGWRAVAAAIPTTKPRS